MVSGHQIENFKLDFRRRLPENVFRQIVMDSLKQTDNENPEPRGSKRAHNETFPSTSKKSSKKQKSIEKNKPAIQETKIQSLSDLPGYAEYQKYVERLTEITAYEDFTKNCEPIFAKRYLMQQGMNDTRQKSRIIKKMRIKISRHCGRRVRCFLPVV